MGREGSGNKSSSPLVFFTFNARMQPVIARYSLAHSRTVWRSDGAHWSRSASDVGHKSGEMGAVSDLALGRVAFCLLDLRTNAEE